MATVTFAAEPAPRMTEAEPFNVELDVPEGFDHASRVTPELIYPVEVAAISNWSVPPNTDDAWPRVDVIPEGGLLLWIVRGDVAFDYQEMPSQGDWFEPAAYTYMNASEKEPSGRPSPGEPEVIEAQRALSGSDRVENPWTGANTWARFVPLTDSAGQPRERPPYLVIYVFSGGEEPPLDEISRMVETLTVRYT